MRSFRARRKPRESLAPRKRPPLTVAHLVQYYGDVAQVVTGLVSELSMVIPAIDFQTLNLCVDDAIANAVSEYPRQRTIRGRG